MNQIIGGDAATLLLVAPLALLAGVLAFRNHPAAPVLALAPAGYGLYTFAQLVMGQEYLDLPGNNERFFGLHLAVFILAGAVFVLAWQRTPRGPSSLNSRTRRRAAALLLVIALFVALGLHAPSLADALSSQPTRVEYLSSPTAFWVVKLMDLGIVVPVDAAAGIGLLRNAPWAPNVAVALLGGYTLLAASVTGMAVVMLINHDPDASVATAAAAAGLTVLLAAMSRPVYAPLFSAPPGPGRHDQEAVR